MAGRGAAWLGWAGRGGAGLGAAPQLKASITQGSPQPVSSFGWRYLQRAVVSLTPCKASPMTPGSCILLTAAGVVLLLWFVITTPPDDLK